MVGSLRIARVAGIDIKLHFTFLFVVLLGAWQWGGFGPRGALFGVLLTLLMFLSVTLHELGHSLVAQRFGITVRDITLTPLGGIAQLASRPKTPGQELLVALAGPLVNVALALGLAMFAEWQWGLDGVRRAVERSHTFAPTAATLVGWLLISNFALAAFNLLPALPMDGGRVLRAVLTWPLGLERATRWAALVGRVFAVGFVGLGLYGPNLILALIGAFVFVAAGAEERAVRLERVLCGIRARDAVNPYAPRFLPGTTLGEAVQALVFTPYSAFAVEHFGRLLGVVTRAELAHAFHERGPGAFVAGVMHRSVPSIAADDPLEVARLKMNEALSSYVAVTDQDLFIGLVTEMDLAQALGVADRLRGPTRRDAADAPGW
jgi:Zn-dependent protease